VDQNIAIPIGFEKKSSTGILPVQSETILPLTT